GEGAAGGCTAAARQRQAAREKNPRGVVHLGAGPPGAGNPQARNRPPGPHLPPPPPATPPATRSTAARRAERLSADLAIRCLRRDAADRGLPRQQLGEGVATRREPRGRGTRYGNRRRREFQHWRLV